VVDDAYRSEIERRVGRPFDRVREQLEDLFDEEWDDVLIVIETSATKTNRSHADVIAQLIERAERKPSAQQRVKRSVIRWIGKPWRERENPWDKFKDRVPPPPPRVKQDADDLDEWTPLRPDEQ
jgi:hypothetical protein